MKSLKLKTSNIMFIFLIIVYCSTVSDDISNKTSLLKYIALFLCIIEIYPKYLKRKSRDFNLEFKKIALFVIILVIYSIFISIKKLHFSFRTIQELLFLICPMIYSYLMINTLEKEDIIKNMRLALIISFSFYLISLDMDFKTILNSIFNASFSDSSSQLESHLFCGLSLAFSVFFSYYDKNKIYKYLGLLFVIMTFKRLFLVMALFLFMLSKFKIRNKKINKNIYITTIIFFMLLSVVYYNCMIPQNVNYLDEKYDINISKLTSTRSDRMRMLYNSSYETYGFGSSTEFMYKYFDGALEMDIIKIIIELGFIPAFMLLISYINLSKNNLYTYIFMLFLILNLILSSGLTSSISWSLFFLIILTIQKYPERRKKIVYKY